MNPDLLSAKAYRPHPRTADTIEPMVMEDSPIVRRIRTAANWAAAFVILILLPVCALIAATTPGFQIW